MKTKKNEVYVLFLLFSFMLGGIFFLNNFPIKVKGLDDAAPVGYVPEAWDYPDSDGQYNHTLGTGVKVAVIDSGIDWQHPDFFRPNFSQVYDVREVGGTPYIDFDGDSSFTAGEGGIINNTYIERNWTNIASTAVEPGIDYGYNDSDGSSTYDFGETICYYLDENEDGIVNDGDKAVALGESKIEIIRDYSTGKNFVNGVNLTDTLINDHVDSDGHGTHVAGIVAGGWPQIRNFTGVAPNCTLLFYNYYNIGQAIQDAVNDGADIISMSLGEQFRDKTLDGSGPFEGGSAFDYYVDWAYDQGVTVVTSAGNSANDDLHTFNEVPAFSVTPGEFSINFNIDSGNIIEFDFTNIWTSPNTEIGVNVTIPNPEGAGTITIPDEYYNSSLPWDGLAHTYQPTTLTQPLIIERYRNNANINGVNKSFINITYAGGAFSSGVGTYKILNFGSNNQKVHTYTNSYFSGGSWASGYPGIYWAEYVDQNYTISSLGTANHSITVGSFISHEYYIWDPYLQGDISSFSSRGPRIDGERALDIAAPGEILLSAASQDATGNSFNIGNYTAKQGTSMAAPFVSGLLALALESNNYLKGKPDLVQDLLINSTYEDQFTKQYGEGYNNVFGYGKVNASRMLLQSQGPEISDPSVNSNGYPYGLTISSTIRDFKGVNEAYVYYTNDSWTSTYQKQLSNVGGDIYSADINGQALDTTIEYYITANDTFGIPSTNDNDGSNFNYFYTDISAPLVTILNPAMSSIFSPPELDINASITDETSLSSVYVKINASTPFILDMAFIDGKWTCTWNNISDVSYTAGDYNFTIWAYDSKNNLNNTESVIARLVKDFTPPIITFLQPLNESSVYEAFNISALIIDTNAPQSGDVFATIYNKTVGFSIGIEMTYNGSDEWIAEWSNITKYQPGEYYINITAYDSSVNRNMNQTGYLNITFIDIYGPKVVIDNPGPGSYPETSIDINATITDLESSVKEASARINATVPFELPMSLIDGIWTCMWDNISDPSFSAGDYNISIWAMDAFGNINDTEFVVISITKDDKGPNIVFLSPSNNTITYSSFEIIAEITDQYDPNQGDVYATIYNGSAGVGFNISMIREGSTDQWSVQWSNLTTHYFPGYYYINITAVDSSPYNNINSTGFLNISYVLDTFKPNIEFLSPEVNQTTITDEEFLISVNVTDDNLPRDGDVIFTLFNSSGESLFNATMINEGGTIWNYNWDNVSTYTNGETYIIRVVAQDSSPNNNLNSSLQMYVSLDLPEEESTDSGEKDGGEDGSIDVVSLVFAMVSLLGIVLVFAIAVKIDKPKATKKDEANRIQQIVEDM